MQAAYIMDLLALIICTGITVFGVFLLISFIILFIGEKKEWWS